MEQFLRLLKIYEYAHAELVDYTATGYESGVLEDLSFEELKTAYEKTRKNLIDYATKKIEGESFEGWTESDLNDVLLLRNAGCKCHVPLLGYLPGVGPRCRLCNTVVEDTK